MARRHVADAGAVALNLIIQEFMESGGSIARHSHEFGCERGRRQRPLEPPSVRVSGGREAVGEPVDGGCGADNAVPTDNRRKIVNSE